jgi:hypothetical protein
MALPLALRGWAVQVIARAPDAAFEDVDDAELASDVGNLRLLAFARTWNPRRRCAVGSRMIKAPHPSVGVCIMRTVLLAASRAALFSESAHAAPPSGGGTATASPSRMVVFGNDNVSGMQTIPFTSIRGLWCRHHSGPSPLTDELRRSNQNS